MHKIMRHKIEPAGATFTCRNEDFLVSSDPDFHPTDVFEDADGSLLVIDTGGWFRIGCPTSQIAKPDVMGGIYRVRKPAPKPLADPRGLTIAWNSLSAARAGEAVGRSALRGARPGRSAHWPNWAPSQSAAGRCVLGGTRPLKTTCARGVGVDANRRR